MRKVIASLSVSVDGFIEGPKGDLDLDTGDDVASWKAVFEMLDTVDACVLGRVMYPGYEEYWMSVLANPNGPLPLSGKPATKNEVAYARWADKTPHIVVSKTLDKVAWKNARIARDIDEIRELKQQAGKNIYVVGGATLVSSLVNHGLIDELNLKVDPMILGSGKALFKDVSQPHRLKLVRIQPVGTDKVYLTYRIQG